jgi:hypothetical protein
VAHRGSGKQFVSWIHEADFIAAIEYLIAHDELDGTVNISAPGPLPNRGFMRALRKAWGARVGLPATEWVLEVGAVFLRIETELILKSRRVTPGRLLQADSSFNFPNGPRPPATWLRDGEQATNIHISRSADSVYEIRRHKNLLMKSALGKIAYPVPGERMHEQRRSRRILSAVSLEILANGEAIPASTAVINLHGAMMLCSVKWPQGSELKFKNPENGFVARGRVVWSGDVTPNGLHKLGVEFAAASPELWGSHYDPNSLETPEAAAAEEAKAAESVEKHAMPTRR